VLQAASLVEAVLKCLGCSSKKVAETAVEYFDALCTVPMSERHPYFGAPMFAQLLQPLLSHARYPADFTSWEECVEEDSDDFHRFRYPLSCVVVAVLQQLPSPSLTQKELPWVCLKPAHVCRDHALGDILGCAYIVLRMQYLQHCGSLYSHAATWQDKELALYAIRWRCQSLIVHLIILCSALSKHGLSMTLWST
jgi:hypothetical protein